MQVAEQRHAKLGSAPPRLPCAADPQRPFPRSAGQFQSSLWSRALPHPCPLIAESNSGVTGTVASSGLAAAEGAGYGALNASGHDQDVAEGALMGAIFGGAGNAAGEAVATDARKRAASPGPGNASLRTPLFGPRSNG